jgi:hypothetical protein
VPEAVEAGEAVDASVPPRPRPPWSSELEAADGASPLLAVLAVLAS